MHPPKSDADITTRTEANVTPKDPLDGRSPPPRPRPRGPMRAAAAGFIDGSRNLVSGALLLTKVAKTWKQGRSLRAGDGGRRKGKCSSKAALAAAFGDGTPAYIRYKRAASLDNGPHTMRMGNAFGRGPQIDYDARDAREAHQYLSRPAVIGQR